MDMVIKKMIPDVCNENWIENHAFGKNNCTLTNSYDHKIWHENLAIFITSSCKMIWISYLLRNLY